MICIELIKCRGHPNVQLSHGSTMEFDRADRLTPRGDCVACVSCKGGGRCSGIKGLGAVYVAALGLEAPFYAGFRIYGVSLGKHVNRRMIVRRSKHSVDSLLVRASAAARDAPMSLRRLLASSFTRCLVLHAVLSVDTEDVLTRSIVKDTCTADNP